MSQILLPWQRVSLGEKFAWHHSMAYTRKPLCRRKNFADIFYISRVIANFVLNFVAMATRFAWQHSLAYPENPIIDAKILQISFTQTEL